MSQSVNVPGVGTLQFPDGMSQDDMAAAIRKNFPEIHQEKLSPIQLAAKLKADYAANSTPQARAQRFQEEQQKQVADMSTFDKVAAGAGKAIADTGRGIGQLLGLESRDDIARSRQNDQALMATGAGVAGNALGYLGEGAVGAIAAPAALGAAGLGGLATAGAGAKITLGAALGGAQGYAAPYASTGEHVGNTLAGAGLGALIPGLGAATRGIASKAVSPEVKELMQMGVKLTPGQKLGGAALTAEQRATSIPGTGDVIQNAQDNARRTFNTAIYNKALEPLGVKVDGAGRQALKVARDHISNAYNNSVGKMSGTLDSEMNKQVAQLYNNAAKNLPVEKVDTLERIIRNEVYNRFDTTGKAAGTQLKKIYSELGGQVRKLGQSEHYDDRALAKSIGELQGSVRDMLERQNPKDLNQLLDNADKAHRQMLVVEKAASYKGAKDGVFTPSQLQSASRRMDSSLRQMASTHGHATLQDIAEKADKVLGSKVADSGTAGRLMNATPQGLMAGLVSSPLGALYTQTGQAIAARAMQPRLSPVTNYLTQLAARRFGQSQGAPSQIPQQ